MSEESPQIGGGRIQHPDGGEAIVAQQVEDMQGVAAIGLRLANDHSANLRGITNKQRVPKALQEGVQPDGIARALNPDGHRVLHAVIREHLEPFPSPLVSWVRSKDKIPLTPA